MSIPVLNMSASLKALAAYDRDHSTLLYVKEEGGECSLAVASKLGEKVKGAFQSMSVFSLSRIDRVKKDIVATAFKTNEDVFELIDHKVLPKHVLNDRESTEAMLPARREMTEEWVNKGGLQRPQITIEGWVNQANQMSMELKAGIIDPYERQQHHSRVQAHQKRKIDKDSIDKKLNIQADFLSRAIEDHCRLAGKDFTKNLGNKYEKARSDLTGLCKQILSAKESPNAEGKSVELLEKELIVHVQMMKGESLGGRFRSQAIKESKEIYQAVLKQLDLNRNHLLAELEEPKIVIELPEEVRSAYGQKDALSTPENQKEVAAYMLFSKIKESLESWEAAQNPKSFIKDKEKLEEREKKEKEEAPVRDRNLKEACLNYCTSADFNQRMEGKWALVEIVKQVDGDIFALFLELNNVDKGLYRDDIARPEQKLFHEIQQMKVETDLVKKEGQHVALNNLCNLYGLADEEGKIALKNLIIEKAQAHGDDWTNVFSSNNQEEIQKQMKEKLEQLANVEVRSPEEEEAYKHVLFALCQRYCVESTQNERNAIEAAIKAMVGADVERLSDLLKETDAIYPPITEKRKKELRNERWNAQQTQTPRKATLKALEAEIKEEKRVLKVQKKYDDALQKALKMEEANAKPPVQRVGRRREYRNMAKQL